MNGTWRKETLAGATMAVGLMLAACGGGGGAADSRDAPDATENEAADGIGAAADNSAGDLRAGIVTFQLSTGAQLTADVVCQLDPAGAGDPEKQFEVTSTGSPSFHLTVLRETLPLAEVLWEGEQTWRSEPNVAALLADTLISGYGSFTAAGEGNDSVPGRFHVDCDP